MQRGSMEWPWVLPGLLWGYETPGTSTQAIQRYAYVPQGVWTGSRAVNRATRRAVGCQGNPLPPVAMGNVAFYRFLPAQGRNEDLQL